jgi:hypothetical protein
MFTPELVAMGMGENPQLAIGNWLKEKTLPASDCLLPA